MERSKSTRKCVQVILENGKKWVKIFVKKMDSKFEIFKKLPKNPEKILEYKSRSAESKNIA